MKKTLFSLCLMIAITILSACSDEPDSNMVKINASSDEIVGENYQTVVSNLKETGFTNVETKVLDDLITGWLTKDGEVEQIEINGNTEFGINESFQKDSKIVITYHTFAKEEKSVNEPTDDKDLGTDEETSGEEKSTETAEQIASDTSAESNEEILTAKNNEELAAVLAVQDTNDLIVSEFAKKYAGRTIEFDGYIANMMPHGKYDTRYDILINVGDYNQTTFNGPDFKFEDVNVFDLNLNGSEIPDTIGEGQNLHITAVVEEYDENPGLFFLKPISSKIR